VIAGSSMAMVKRLLENTRFQQGSWWFRRLGGVAIGIFGIYFIMRPFWEA
jgi:cytochrome c-type biogenesis protein